jgi:transposase
MGKAVSSDLRLRVVRDVEEGSSRRAAADRFVVSAATAVRIVARYAATGSVEPAKQGRPKGSGKLGRCRDMIIEHVKAQPDITMPALAAWLGAEHGIKADPSNLSKFLIQEGLSYKKNTTGIGARTFRR